MTIDTQFANRIRVWMFIRRILHLLLMIWSFEKNALSTSKTNLNYFFQITATTRKSSLDRSALIIRSNPSMPFEKKEVEKTSCHFKHDVVSVRIRHESSDNHWYRMQCLNLFRICFSLKFEIMDKSIILFFVVKNSLFFWQKEDGFKINMTFPEKLFNIRSLCDPKHQWSFIMIRMQKCSMKE